MFKADRNFIGSLGLTALAALGGCSADEGAGAEPADVAKPGAASQPPSLAGKADVGQRVALRGDLAFATDTAGSFSADLQFDAYPLTVRPGAVVDLEVVRRGTARALDPTLFVFGPLRQGEYGDTALAYDDDAGWGAYPRLRGLSLADGGQYLVVVGTHDARGRGRYTLRAECRSGDCVAAPEPLPTACPLAVVAAVRACVADQLADVDAPFADAAEARAACLDAEPLAVGFDAACAAGEPAGCGRPYAEVWQPLAAVCAAALADDDGPAPAPAACLLGEVYADHRAMPGLVVVHRAVLETAAGLDALTAAQVLDAVRQSAWSDVPDVETAFATVDAGGINRTELYDVGHARGLVVYEYGAGDNSYGAYYRLESTERVARINDGDVMDCRVAGGPAGAGPIGADCAATADCAAGLSCHGVHAEAPRGRCLPLDAPRSEADGQTCNAETACPAGAGLVCAGISKGDGLCGPAWLRETFRDDAAVEVGAEGLSRTLPVYGLASVDTDVWLQGVLLGNPGGRVRVTLENPATTQVLVHDGDFEGYLSLTGAIFGFSGDESVNGTWTLRITGAEGATLEGWRLTVGSRWD